ncbi:hypothetical protein HEK616_33070 [Streptomyces nigrescens]|uniref:Uncharacterized protein n=1 Tax=Streptomyces nigrescens TaxID=1920 RepID=A0ABM7ZTW1_STRNI|nr:hypothetical protein HEK616_33070 [Streptomyces nigrescens]
MCAPYLVSWLGRDPHHYPTQLPRFRTLRHAFTRLDPGHIRLLRSLIASHRWLPDFLTPRPVPPWPDFHDECAALRATPPEHVPRDLPFEAAAEMDRTGTGSTGTPSGSGPRKGRRTGPGQPASRSAARSPRRPTGSTP